MPDTLIDRSAVNVAHQPLSHIRQLEAESIHIIREVARSFKSR